jgi:hypothetical protein
MESVRIRQGMQVGNAGVATDGGGGEPGVGLVANALVIFGFLCRFFASQFEHGDPSM